ncbi:MAG: hypothetical protein ABSF94_15285 [Steroidobacteraceae bacterium]|jgi:hypothetical protein
MRRYSHLCRSFVVLAFGMAAAACHHSSSSISTATATADPEGIWMGTDQNGLSLTGFINAAGQSEFLRSDGTLFSGTLIISEATLAGTLDGYAQIGTTFADGTNFGLGTFGGTVVTRSSIDANWNFTTIDSMTTDNIWTLTYNSLYAKPSSLGSIAGSYTVSEPNGPSDGSTIAISATGAISGTNSATGCVLTGQVTVNYPTKDVYQIALSYASCTEAVLNGIPFTGLGILDTTVTPAQVLIGVTGEAANQTDPNKINFGLAMMLTAS